MHGHLNVKKGIPLSNQWYFLNDKKSVEKPEENSTVYTMVPPPVANTSSKLHPLLNFVCLLVYKKRLY
jgi:hypothetical protein